MVKGRLKHYARLEDACKVTLKYGDLADDWKLYAAVSAEEYLTRIH